MSRDQSYVNCALQGCNVGIPPELFRLKNNRGRPKHDTCHDDQAFWNTIGDGLMSNVDRFNFTQNLTVSHMSRSGVETPLAIMTPSMFLDSPCEVSLVFETSTSVTAAAQGCLDQR